MFHLLFSLIALLVCGFLAINTIYVVIFAIAGRLGKPDDTLVLATVNQYRRIAVLIPAYKEDSVIINSVLANLQQTYLSDAFDLIVIADSFQASTLEKLRALPIRVVEVSFEVSSVAKSLKAGMASLSENRYDIVLVSDADNHMAPDFLSRINAAFEQGWRAVQGHRVAKNTNTPVAILDAISEEINNHIFRRGHRVLGLSPSFIGSGMALEFGIIHSYLTQALDIGGYDKELDLFVREKQIKVGFLEHAYIYDEKVQNSAVFEHQRTRWMEAHLRYVKDYFFKGISFLFRGNLDYADKVFQLFILPRLLLLGSVILCFLLSLVLNMDWFWKAMAVQVVLVVLALAISTPRRLIRLIGPSELLMVPLLFLRFIRSALHIRKARGRFLHTPHGIDTEVSS